jgi:hypothetical protein
MLHQIVIFVLSAQNDCFLLGHENEFLVETSNSFECANKTMIFRTKYKHYFFYNSILKFLNFLFFVKFSLDAKIFVKKFPWMLKYNYFSIQGNFLTNIFSLSKMTYFAT